jgi:hypothetical protein
MARLDKDGGGQLCIETADEVAALTAARRFIPLRPVGGVQPELVVWPGLFLL